MSNILNIENKESGESVRAKLNDAIAEINALGSADIGTTITDDRALVAADAGKFFLVNKASEVTLTLNEGEFNKGDRIELHQVDAGLISVVVQSSTNQDINAESFSKELGNKIEVLCVDDTENAEVFVVSNGQADPNV